MRKKHSNVAAAEAVASPLLFGPAIAPLLTKFKFIRLRLTNWNSKGMERPRGRFVHFDASIKCANALAQRKTAFVELPFSSFRVRFV